MRVWVCVYLRIYAYLCYFFCVCMYFFCFLMLQMHMYVYAHLYLSACWVCPSVQISKCACGVLRSRVFVGVYSISQEVCARFCFAVLYCGYALTDFPMSIGLASLALWQSNDCPSAGGATLMNMDKYFMWIHYERLHDRSRAGHGGAVCVFLAIYCA